MKHNTISATLIRVVHITLSVVLASISLPAAGVTEVPVHAALRLPSGVLLVATEYGIHRSDDRLGKNLSQIVSTLNVQSLALSPTSRVVAAASDGSVYMSNSDAKEWHMIRPADGVASVLTAVGSVLVDRDNIIYLCRPGHGVDRSVDDGATWSELRDGTSQLVDLSCVTLDELGNVYAGTESRGILRYNEQTKRWDPLLLMTNKLPYIESLRISSDGTIMVGGSNDVYCSYDMGRNWTRTLLFDEQSGGGLSAVEDFDIYDRTSILALTTNGVFESTDGGRHWHASATPSSIDDTREYLCIGSRLCAKTSHGIVRVSQWSATQPHG